MYNGKGRNKLKASNKIRKVNSTNPETDIIAEAAGIIINGGVVVFPTRSLYGMGADAFSAKAVNRVFHIKQRPAGKPILVLIKDKDELERLALFVPPAAVAIMESFWPGRVTIVFQAKQHLLANLTAGTNKIGIRLPGHDVAHALVKTAKIPITGTSANLSGNTGCFRVDDLDKTIVDGVDLILDAGPLNGGAGSTIVDITAKTPLILRQGVLSQRDISNVIDNLRLF